MLQPTIFITGGAGFIGSALVHYLIQHTDYSIVNIDKLTYAGHLSSLETILNHPRHTFIQADINDSCLLDKLFKQHQPCGIIHLAAESHVDNAILSPSAFIETNIVGTYTLLEAARTFYSRLDSEKKAEFRFHHISTDEVFGDLEGTTALFTETTPYAPSSPYSASKAASDHLVRAWHRTYGLPVVLSNCSNNYGPYHFPEKLIPLVILNAIQGNALPIYGKGDQIRDWLFVEDHARALYLVMSEGKVGESYNIGGHNEKTNLEVVKTICTILDQIKPCSENTALLNIQNYAELITFVQDRPGHDKRYAIDAAKIQCELGWKPQETFESGIRKTVEWYLANESWWRRIYDGSYNGQRLGLQPELPAEKAGA